MVAAPLTGDKDVIMSGTQALGFRVQGVGLGVRCFGALVLCIKPTSSLPVLQIPILHYEISYG